MSTVEAEQAEKAKGGERCQQITDTGGFANDLPDQGRTCEQVFEDIDRRVAQRAVAMKIGGLFDTVDGGGVAGDDDEGGEGEPNQAEGEDGAAGQ